MRDPLVPGSLQEDSEQVAISVVAPFEPNVTTVEAEGVSLLNDQAHGLIEAHLATAVVRIAGLVGVRLRARRQIEQEGAQGRVGSSPPSSRSCLDRSHSNALTCRG